MILEITLEGGKKVNASMNGYTIKTDQPLENGGEGSAPAPFDLYLASIGTCAGIYIKSFCDRREIPSDNIKIIQKIEFDREKRVPSVISLEIKVPDDFPDKYRDALINAAELCAVKKSIASPPRFEITTGSH